MAGGLLALAVAPRVGALGPSSLWQDDAWPALVARLHAPGDIALVGVTSVGWSFLLKGVLAVGGLHSTVAQAPAFVAGVVAPLLVVVLARRIGLGRVAAVTAGVLLAVAPAGVLASVRVKSNTTAGLLAVLVLLAAWAALDGAGRRRDWVVVVALSVAAMVVTLEVAPVVAGVVAASAAVGVHQRRWRPEVSAAVATAALSVAWILLVVPGAVTETVRDDWAEGYVPLDEGPAGLVRGSAARVVDLGQALSGVWPVALVLVAAGAGVLLARRRRPLAVLLLVPVLVVFGASLLHLAPIGAGANRGRVNLAVHPVLVLLAAHAVDALALRWRRAGVVVAVAVAAVSVLAVPAATYRVEDLRPVVAALDARARPEDLVLVDPVGEWGTALYTASPVSVYADDRTATPFRPRIDRPRTVIPDWFRGREPSGYYDDLVGDAVEGVRRVWLVRLDHGGAEALAAALAARGFRSQVVARAPGASLERWDR